MSNPNGWTVAPIVGIATILKTVVDRRHAAERKPVGRRAWG